MYRTKVSKLQADIASLRKKLGQEKAIEAKKTSDLTNVQRSITKRTSSSSLRMKENKINRLLAEVAKTQKRIADLEKRIASKTKELHSYETRLSKAEAKEGKSRRAEELRHERALTREVEKRRQIEAVRDRISAEFPDYDDFVDEGGQDAYSVFISHASEDKEAFVAPLAQLLSQMGFRVWYDDFVLTVGDSLRQSIDKGIANSAYGLYRSVPAFFHQGLDAARVRRADRS
jgi:vacuolar-type H+-ATPase subunit I/STV1